MPGDDGYAPSSSSLRGLLEGPGRGAESSRACSRPAAGVSVPGSLASLSSSSLGAGGVLARFAMTKPLVTSVPPRIMAQEGTIPLRWPCGGMGRGWRSRAVAGRCWHIARSRRLVASCLAVETRRHRGPLHGVRSRGDEVRQHRHGDG